MLRILQVEDDELDTELIKGILKRRGVGFEIDRVQSMPQYRAALESKRHSIVLCDYSVPGLDALDVLRVTRELAPDLPFIFLSGTMGEELAIETLRLGATDYVLKQHHARLLPAIERALQESREQALRKAAEAAVHESGAKLRLALDSANMGTFDLQSHLRYYLTG